MVFNIRIQKNLKNTSAGNNGFLKEVSGVNGSPISIAPGFPDLEDQFNQMGITHIRLHDIFGIGDIDNGFVANRRGNQDQMIINVPAASKAKARTFIAEYSNKRTIFPYAAAGMRAKDLSLAMRNVNYAPTDSYLKRILDNNPSVNPTNITRQVMIRVGRTLDGGYEVPEDFDIYASLVGELAKRYSLNYQAIGLPRKVTYWEIWNEPDLTFFWNNNNPQVYYQFYSKVARMIKSIDPDAKVGGCGVANGYNPGGAYIDGLLNYCRTTDTPIDFLSWHYYGNLTADPQNILDIGNALQTSLNRYGYNNIESICTEWNSSPFGNTNILSNVQSSTNAAYLTSALMFMQYCKTDKAYYYRGDASAFGLFNNHPNPTSPAYKSFCTYAAQGFSLYNRMFETPYILTQSNSFNTGITTLAGENAAGNKLNILCANYQVDRSFTSGVTQKFRYEQHYLDTNRTVNQLNDDWSKQHWFGGVDPNTVTTDNTVTQRTVVPQLPSNASLPTRTRNYTQSNTGVSFEITNIASGFTGYKLTAYRIQEGGRLDRMTPTEVSASITSSYSGGVLRITDTGAGPSTVTLYSIDFIGQNTGNTGGNGGNTGGNGGNNGGNGGNGGTVGGVVEYSFTVPTDKRLPFSAILPPDYYFEANKRYFLEITSTYSGLYSCAGSTCFNPSTQSCNLAQQPNYSLYLNIFIPKISGVLHNNPALVGGSYVAKADRPGRIFTCRISPL